MNDFLDALSARIKAPYFGYSLLAFIALNWRGIFLLGVTEGEPAERLAAFDAVTNTWTLVVFPLVIGALVAASAQWVRYIFAVVSRRPLDMLEKMRLVAEDRSLVHKAALERSRNELLAAREEGVIARAERDQKVSEIENPEKRVQLEADLERLREEEDRAQRAIEEWPNTFALSPTEQELIRAAGHKRTDGSITKLDYLSGRSIQAGLRTFGSDSPRDYERYDFALEKLVKQGFLKQISSTSYHLSSSGWGAVDLLGT